MSWPQAFAIGQFVGVLAAGYFGGWSGARALAARLRRTEGRLEDVEAGQAALGARVRWMLERDPERTPAVR